MITVCPHCTRVRADDGTWVYAHILPEEEKSHECCPDCEVEQDAENDRFAERMAAATAVIEGGAECSDG